MRARLNHDKIPLIQGVGTERPITWRGSCNCLGGEPCGKCSFRESQARGRYSRWLESARMRLRWFGAFSAALASLGLATGAQAVPIDDWGSWHAPRYEHHRNDPPVAFGWPHHSVAEFAWPGDDDGRRGEFAHIFRAGLGDKLFDEIFGDCSRDGWALASWGPFSLIHHHRYFWPERAAAPPSAPFPQAPSPRAFGAAIRRPGQRSGR